MINSKKKSFKDIADQNRTPQKKASTLNASLFNKQLSYNITDYDGIPDINKQVIEIIPMVKSAFCRIEVPQVLMDNLNIYLDRIYKDPNAESRSNNLVGAIKMLSGKKGKQLVMDMDDDLVKPFSEFILLCSKIYMSQMYNLDNIDNDTYKLIVDEVWSVHQYETDFNPHHQHSNSISNFGLSSFLHTKLPKQLLDRYTKKNKQYEGGGWYDGKTMLSWGNLSFEDQKQLKFPQTLYTTGETGILYLFPQWLIHGVYPFFGKGERRTVASNISIKY